MQKKKIKIIGLVSIFIGLLIIVGISIYQMINFYVDSYNNEKDLDTIIKKVINTNEKEFTVDFDELLKINKDVKGWIRFNQISYPILQAEDNNYYLNKTIYGKKNSLGSIFMDHRNISFADQNVVIFGHNAANGSMFGSLKNIFKKDYFENNDKIIEIRDLNNNVLQYEIFSYYSIDKEEYYITTSFSSDEEYMNFLNNIKNRSFKKFDISLTANDKIITLSTCRGGDKRTVIHAKFIKQL